jgi:predicted metal-dependent hydrolase
VTPEDWRSSQDYLFGIDLYNAGFLWEAHEAWEGLWHVSKHDSTQANFIQGLIQCTAGCLKIPMGQARGMEKLFEMGTGRLLSVVREVGPEYMGLDIPGFVGEIHAFGASSPPSIEDRPRIELVAN